MVTLRRIEGIQAIQGLIVVSTVCLCVLAITGVVLALVIADPSRTPILTGVAGIGIGGGLLTTLVTMLKVAFRRRTK